MTLSIAEGVTDKQTQPVFDIKLIISDNHPTDPLQKVYDFTLVIVKDYSDPIFEIIEQAKKAEVFNNYEGRVYDLTETSVDEVTKSTEDNNETTEDEVSVPDYKLSAYDISQFEPKVTE